MLHVVTILDSDFDNIFTSKLLTSENELWTQLHIELAETLGFGDEMIVSDNAALEDNLFCPVFWTREAVEREVKTVIRDMFDYRLIVLPIHKYA